MKTITASQKPQKTGPALLKKLARELALIAGGEQKTILRLAAQLALAANGIQPVTALPLDKSGGQDGLVWEAFKRDGFGWEILGSDASGWSAVRVDDTDFARALTAPFMLEQITDSQMAALAKFAKRHTGSVEIFRDPLFVASLREAIVASGGIEQKSAHAVESPLLPTQFFTPQKIAETIARQTPCLPGETILDPACGGGHLLVPVFFECLRQHELASASSTAGGAGVDDGLGSEKRSESHSKDLSSSARGNDRLSSDRHNAEAVARILDSQLFGYDIDQSLVDICGLSLYLAARQVTDAELPLPRIKTLPGPAGSLALTNTIQVDHIVMNPPYQSARTIDSATSDYIKSHYPNASGDLYTSFIELALRLLKDGGTLSAITQQSFLTISRYRQFRLELLERAEFIHYEILGPGVFYFCPGEKVNSVVFTLQKQKAPAVNKVSELCHAVPGNPIVFDAPAELAKIFSDAPQLADIPGIDIVNGLFTCNNKLFVKDASLVTPDEAHLYVPYDKGGGKKWYHQTNLRLHWGEDGNHIREYRAERGQARALPGERFYFKPGVTYSYIGTSGFSARLLSPDSVFDIASSAIFSSEIDQHYILGWLNSSLVIYLLSILNPTVNFQIGDLRRLPFRTPDKELEQEVAGIAARCVKLVQDSAALSERDSEESKQQEALLQEKIDALVFDHYQIKNDLRETVKNDPWVKNSRSREVFSPTSALLV